MSNFQASTQCQGWMFSPEELEATLRASNMKYGRLIHEGKFDPAKPPSCPDRRETQQTEMDPADSTSDSSFLTVEEESMLKIYYSGMIQALCGRNTDELKLRRSSKVQATAIVFFKRFYLANSIMAYDPKIIMLTCVYLASKIEEEIINVADLAQATGQQEDKVLRAEMPVLQGLRFELRCYHPYRALRAFLDDLAAAAGGAGAAAAAAAGAGTAAVAAGAQRLRRLHEGAQALTDRLLVSSNSMFIYPPSDLALAVLALAAEEDSSISEHIDVSKYVKLKIGDKPSYEEFAKKLQSVCDILKQDMNLSENTDKKQLKKIMKKLKGCSAWSKGETSSNDHKQKKRKINDEGKDNTASSPAS